MTSSASDDPSMGGGAGGGSGFGGFGGFEDIFDMFTGGGFGGSSSRGRSQNAPQRGSDLQYNLTLTFEEAAFGCRKEFKFQRGAVCKACAGTGAKPGTQPQTCPTCHGSGQQRVTMNSPFGQVQTMRTCPTCGGKGKIIKDKCSECSGTRLHPRDAHRDAERSGGRGRRSEFQDHLAGRRRTWPQRRPGGRPVHHLHRAGRTRFSSATVTTCTAMCRFPSHRRLWAAKSTCRRLAVRPSTTFRRARRRARHFRIRGEGIQQMRGTSRGDLFFTVHVEVPKHLGEKQKELLRQFEDSLNGREYERRKSFGDQVKSYIRDNAERFKEKFEKK